MCKKQTSVSHSSTESEIISLDAGLRMDGIPALDLWDVVIEVLLHRITRNHQPKKLLALVCTCLTREQLETACTSQTPSLKNKGDQNVEQLSNLDHVATNASSSQCESQLYFFEYNEAVIKMIIKGRSPTMRHVARTHRVALDWLFDKINLDPKIQIKHVDTKNQLADLLTKGSFTRDEWSNLLRLFNIMNFSMFTHSHFRSKEKAYTMSKKKGRPEKSLR